MIKKLVDSIAKRILELAANVLKEKISRVIYILEERAKKTPNEIDDKIVQILKDIIRS